MSDEITDTGKGQQGWSFTRGALTSGGDSGDIAAVVEAYHLSSVDYRDFSSASARASALSHWPLLAELNNKKAAI
ncbi:Protein of uncharacterised function (DUF2629) [Leminorella richardii]|uniref:Protein of uncharacterized function (DUF2629) n=1 Tax=Leminorella richardii TaxID=158841 RepID=A0A2X4U5D9_9GAMM|nr:BcsR/BcsP family cellulose biosynthesis protein [Leminorella richardii]SQI34403.1 Protein of uncharacterised function (DUF2629) [Leminorella richardii]